MSWTLLLVATVGLSVAETQDVAREDRERILDALEKTIGEVSGRRVVRDTDLWGSCGNKPHCVDEVRARTGTTDVVIVAAFGGVTRVRVVVQRHRSKAPTAEVKLQVPLGADPTAAIRDAIRKLFPEGPPEIVVDGPPPPPPPEPTLTLWPTWVAGGVAVAAAGGAIGFGLSASSAASSVRERISAPDEFDRASDRASTHGTISNTLIVTAGVAAAVAAVWVVLESIERGEDTATGG